jgi:Sec-independent protein translocase protein TatA
LGIVEIIVILVVALIVIPPENLPDVMRATGKVLRELRLASNMVMRELGGALDQQPPPRDVPPINTMRPSTTATAPNIAQTTASTESNAATAPVESAIAADSPDATVKSADAPATPTTHS